LRINADRSIRLAIKPVIDLLKNKAHLASEDANTRRSAATDLGMLGKPVAIPWLEQAAVREPNRWVRYTMEEAAQLLTLGSEDPVEFAFAHPVLGIGYCVRPDGCHQYGPWRVNDGRGLCDLCDPGMFQGLSSSRPLRLLFLGFHTPLVSRGGAVRLVFRSNR